MERSEPRYRRVLLKISGELLGGSGGEALSEGNLKFIIDEISEVVELLGLEVGLVVGAGNIVRGGSLHGKLGIDRPTADYMGMIGTIINSLALQSAFEKRGLKATVMSPLEIRGVVEAYTIRGALDRLSKGEIVIFAGGTGSPYFTTDTAAALRAVETGCDVLLKGTKVDGVFDRDPEVYPDAQKIDKISFDDVIRRELRVMDITAFTLCRENSLPIIVFNLTERGNLRKAVLGEKVGTFVWSKKEA